MTGELFSLGFREAQCDAIMQAGRVCPASMLLTFTPTFELRPVPWLWLALPARLRQPKEQDTGPHLPVHHRHKAEFGWADRPLQIN